MDPTLTDRCRAIVWLVLDVDGVLTDGQIIYSDKGEELKAFHVRDGSAIKLWLAQGKRVALLSGRKSLIVDRRGAELGVTAIVQGAEEKLPAFEGLLKQYGVPASQVAYVGDDLADVPVLRRVGLAVAVGDACPEARADAHYVTQARGGQGVVREVVELILKGQDRWPTIVATYRR
jgi:3-deoxy-D-manno-octulosonate 8-phosphate phosphatase (KDO 8-P phosphatase)